MISPGTAFLTALDDRARVKGSVDPLGAMAVWSGLGRSVVGNLTTVTGSLKDFKTLILGFALVEDVRRGLADPRDADDLGVFLRWEQLAAYTRAYISHDFDFRGTRRVRERLNESSVVPISVQRDCQILGNQKVYGLWGLYTVAARASGLIERERNDLTPVAADFVDRVWKRQLGPTWSFLIKSVSEDRPRFKLDREEANLKRLKAIWKTTGAEEDAFWRTHLVQGGPTDRTGGLQRRLAELLGAMPAETKFAINRQAVVHLAQQASAQTPKLTDHLRDIAACESVLAPASALFGYLQTLDRQPLSKALDALESCWPKTALQPDARFKTIRPDIVAASASQQLGELWARIHGAMEAGAWRALIDDVLALNALVMQTRGGAAWVVLEKDVFRVRFRDEAASLPAATELPHLWRNTYFLDSLRAITVGVGA